MLRIWEFFPISLPATNKPIYSGGGEDLRSMERSAFLFIVLILPPISQMLWVVYNKNHKIAVEKNKLKTWLKSKEAALDITKNGVISSIHHSLEVLGLLTQPGFDGLREGWLYSGLCNLEGGYN